MKMHMLRLVGAATVDLPILGADASGPFVLKGADGLGPTEVAVRLSRSVLEQAVYQGKSSALRQITCVVGLQPNWDVGQTAEELRTILYSLLTPRYGQMVRAEIIEDDVVVAYAQGQVSKMEPALFSQDPAVQIVLDCDYPYLLGPDIINQTPVQSNVGGIRAFDVLNEGTAFSGFRAGFVIMSNIDGPLVLSDENPLGQILKIEGIDWMAGDRFLVDTRGGSRGIWRGAGGGAYVSVLNYLNAAVSEWIQLYGGDNRLLLNTASFDWDEEYNFSHRPAYVGV